MRIPQTVFAALASCLWMTGLATASPETQAAKQKFQEKCLASGGTLKQGDKPGVLVCTAPSGSKMTCDFTGDFGFCYGAEAPAAYDKQAAIATQQNRCSADGGTFHKGPGPNSYTCEYADGGAFACSYGPAFYICTGKEGTGFTLSKPLLQKPSGRR